MEEFISSTIASATDLDTAVSIQKRIEKWSALVSKKINDIKSNIDYGVILVKSSQSQDQDFT